MRGISCDVVVAAGEDVDVLTLAPGLWRKGTSGHVSD